ncbi:MAG: hypothetical protein PHS37_07990 [Candidatus Omnitrophica bacterium]|nr:hypothetical protein [Candidatus Omnitrophota bacterium]
MKKMIVMLLMCLAVVSWGTVSYCQYDDQSDSNSGTSDTDNSIEQSEDTMGQQLDSEMGSEQSGMQDEMNQAQESSDSHSTAETQVDEINDSK